MKKVIIAVIVLIAIFISIWLIKANLPVKPQEPTPAETGITPWWEVLAEGETPIADPNWVLDPEVPDNYIPVINADQLYMVFENGKIISYRHRYQLDDGTWIWETVDPNIPENYVAVEGLPNVYLVTDEDGNIHYYRYTRNEDDSFFFTEVDSEGNDLQALPEGDVVPDNYVRIRDNIFGEYNEFGVFTGYRERYENDDGTYEWEDVGFELPEPDIPLTDAPTIDPGSVTVEDPADPDFYDPTQSSGTGNTRVTQTGQDGYVETETITMTEETVRDGIECYVITETIITYYYDNQGVLVSTTKDGPYEVNVIPKTAISEEIVTPNN